MRSWSKLCVYACVLLLGGAFGCGGMEDGYPGDEVSSTRQAIRGGTLALGEPPQFDQGRPEVVSLCPNPPVCAPGCAGVLILPDVVMTAGHCLGYPTFPSTISSGAYVVFQRPQDDDPDPAKRCDYLGAGWVRPDCADAGPCWDHACNYQVAVSTVAHNFGALDGMSLTLPLPGAHDYVDHQEVALVRLTNAVPTSVATPVRISDYLPPHGNPVFAMSYGPLGQCDLHGEGVKNYTTFSFGVDPAGHTCEGDSGGGLFWSDISDLIGIVSTGDNENPLVASHFGNAPYFKEKLLRAVAQLRGDDENYEKHVDRPGSDYSSSYAASATACRTACINDGTNCRAWTYNGTNWCYLKNRVPSWRPTSTAGVYSGINMQTEPNTNRQGSDLGYYWVPANTPDPVMYCMSKCAQKIAGPDCVAYTYVPGSPGSAGVCWVKNSIPGTSYSSTWTSGVRRGREPETDRSGNDITYTLKYEIGECEKYCAIDPKCMAYTWNTTSYRCYKKHSVPGPTYSAVGISGVKRGLEPRSYRTGTPIVTYDYSEPAGVAGRRPEVCQALCAARSDCMSWGYYVGRSGGVPTYFYCNIYSGVGTRIPTSGDYAGDFVSGVKGAEFF